MQKQLNRLKCCLGSTAMGSKNHALDRVQIALGKPAPERQTILDFTGAKNDGAAVASAGP